MSRKFMPSLVHSLRLLWHRRSGNAGFTLIEVLIASAIGSIMISSLLWLVVQLVSSDRREGALAESDREVQLALDYITTDLRESVYIYDGSCSNPDGTSTPCNTYANYLPESLNEPPTVANDKDYSIPVLAFWKTEALDLSALQTSINALPDTDKDDKKECEDFVATKNQDVAIQECEDLLLQRTAYSLVVYVQQRRSDDWSGESQIARYELKKYQDDPVLNSSDLSENLPRNSGYVDPAATGVFRNWPFNANNVNCQADPVTCQLRGFNLEDDPPKIVPFESTWGIYKRVLIDFAAHPNRKYDPVTETSSLALPTTSDPPITPSTLCPLDYLHTPRLDNPKDSIGSGTVLSRNFYACIRRADSGQFQDIIVYLRGNPKGRSGVQTDVIMPLYQTQITMRGVIDRNPTN